MATENKRARTLRRIGALAASAMMLSACGAALPVSTDTTDAPATPIRIKIPTEPFDAVITHVYAQVLENNPAYEVELVEEDTGEENTMEEDAAEAPFFDEAGISSTLQQLRQNEVDVAVLRAGQALHVLEPGSGLIPVPQDSVEPSPWPSTADQKVSELPESLPTALSYGSATSGIRGAQLMIRPATVEWLEIDNAADLAAECDSMSVVVQENLDATHIQAELRALYECVPESITTAPADTVIMEMLAGTYDAAVLDSINPHGTDKGLEKVDGLEPLRPDSYLPLVSTHQFDDQQVGQLIEQLNGVSSRLDDADLQELYRFIHEKPTMTTSAAATWWLQRHGLLPEDA